MFTCMFVSCKVINSMYLLHQNSISKQLELYMVYTDIIMLSL